jgi:hypothetical protein
MEYRNIDNDYKLYHHVKRFYNKELTEIQLKWILKDQNYSDKEISSAISDYYLIHIRSSKFVLILTTFSLLILPLLYILYWTFYD